MGLKELHLKFKYCRCLNNNIPLCDRPGEIPFTLPPRFMAQDHNNLKNVEEKEEGEEIKMETRRDILAHRGSLSVSSRSLLPLFGNMSK